MAGEERRAKIRERLGKKPVAAGELARELGGHSTHSHGGDCPPPEARTAQAATEAAQAVRKGPSEYPNYPEGPAPILSHGTS